MEKGFAYDSIDFDMTYDKVPSEILYAMFMFGNEDFIWKFRIDLNLVFDKLIKTKFGFVSIPPLY